MTDYLELLEEGADALLEQARRLEQALVGRERNREEAGEEGSSPVRSPLRGEQAVPERMLLRGETDRPHEGSPEAALESFGALSLSRAQVDTAWEEGQEREETFPLLEQLRRLESVQVLPQAEQSRAGTRAGSAGRRNAWNGLEWGEGLTGVAGEMPSLPQGRENPAFRLPGGGASPGGEAGWAEQADRVFRRDSRRYDGGFYLY